MNKTTALLLIGFSALLLSIPGGVRAASLSFEDNHYNLLMGQSQKVGLKLNPEGEPVIGTDVIFRFDPQRLEVTEVKNTGALSVTQSVLIDNKTGLVKFSLTNSYGMHLTEIKTIAHIGLKGLSTGPTGIEFDFSPGKTTDTNVASTGGRDVLTGTKALTLSVLPPQVDKSGRVQGGFTSPIVAGGQSAEPPVILGTATDSAYIASEAGWLLADGRDKLVEMAGQAGDKIDSEVVKNPGLLLTSFGVGLALGGVLLGIAGTLYYQERKRPSEQKIGKTW